MMSSAYLMYLLSIDNVYIILNVGESTLICGTLLCIGNSFPVAWPTSSLAFLISRNLHRNFVILLCRFN